mgnify:CR=1 FL=1
MRHFLFLILLALSFSFVSAQGTIDDYKRAASIRGKYSNKMLNGDVQAHAIRDSHKFWYSVTDGTGTVYKEVNPDSNTVSILKDNPEPPRRPPHRPGRQRHWMEVPDEKDGYSVSPDKRSAIVTRKENLWIGQTAEAFKKPQNIGTPDEFPPDYNFEKTLKPLTTNGDSTYYYSSHGSFSSDGKYYATEAKIGRASCRERV